jgi:chromosome segregation ATPase
MTSFLLILWAIVLSGGVAAGLLKVMKKRGAGVDPALAILETARSDRSKLLEQLKDVYGRLVPVAAIRNALKDLSVRQEALRAEKGRITITQAELETVETRLRELEEVERELEASGLETKEELNILKKKEAELNSKNSALKSQLEQAQKALDKAVAEIEMSQQLQEQVLACKTELLQTEQSIATLVLQIEQGNEQYFILKRRYDALDIEYAQLFEKFSEAEALVGSKSESSKQ